MLHMRILHSMIKRISKLRVISEKATLNRLDSNCMIFNIQGVHCASADPSKVKGFSNFAGKGLNPQKIVLYPKPHFYNIYYRRKEEKYHNIGI